MFKKLTSSILMITLIGGCSVSESTFDSTSEETAEASLQAMFPDISFDDDNLPEGADIPPAIDALICNGMKVGFANLDKTKEEIAALVREPFNGMTAADMEAFAVENDYVGCVSNMLEGIKEMEEGLKGMEKAFDEM